MKAESYEALLKALQGLEKQIAAQGIKRGRGPLKAWLKAQHQAAETGGGQAEFLKMVAGRSAVQLILRLLYTRALEDLGLLEPIRIRGQRGLRLFRDLAPSLGIREYFQWIFRDLATDFPALFSPREDELPLPDEPLCQALWDLWHLEDGCGNLCYDWSEGEFESRFLGDLYQDLDQDVRKRYALLQTPDFIEHYILDHTLTPAMAAFDPATLWARGERFRLIDPTCGSGHFLIGGFHRLADYWEARDLEPWEAAVRALESIWGCDINPHAVYIAHFRLTLEVMQRTQVRDLSRLASLPIHLRALDSLIPWEGRRGQHQLFGEARLLEYSTAKERALNAEFLNHHFHAVVGNPPYITPKDPRKRDDYRAFWPESATGGYGLTAPFVERLFDLGCKGGFMGQITGNAFMKRSFGRALIGKVLPRWDLTDIIDTSGAYIPGHGTPTVILFGRCQPPVDEQIRVLGGKRGEPKSPKIAAEGKVWRAIVEAGNEPNDSDPFITVSQYPRQMFGEHPWNLNGGGAPELQEALQRSFNLLNQNADDFGYSFQTNCDPVFLISNEQFKRSPLEKVKHAISVCIGEAIRDFTINDLGLVLFPYGDDSDSIKSYIWKFRETLSSRKTFSGGTYKSDGKKWWEWHQFSNSKHNVPYRITFAFVSTHNHFVLDRGGKVFKQTAPVIKLPPEASLDDHLDLLGLLNSSTLGFWMRQVFHGKHMGDGGSAHADPAYQRFEYDSTKLKKAPISSQDRPERIALAKTLDRIAQERATCLPAAILAGEWSPEDLNTQLEEARAQHQQLTNQMVALQEELDWLAYGSYDLLKSHQTRGPQEIEPLSPGHRPFEILLARHNACCEPEERSAWFKRHGHAEVQAIPEHYNAETQALIQARLDLIAAHSEIRLLEQPQFKRRWQLPDLDAETQKAAASWLLDRLEDLFAPEGELEEPQAYSLEEVVNAWKRDPKVLSIAALHEQTLNFDLHLLAERLLRENALPDNPYRLYTPKGIIKLRAWQEVWRLQDREDAGETLKIEPPPKFGRADFQRGPGYSLRGKLNVPRERFVLFADLFPNRYGWNGWRDLQRSLAQLNAYTLAEDDPLDPLSEPSSADPRRCGVSLPLWESLPDLRRWGGEEADPDELQSFAQEICGQTECPCDLLKPWMEWRDGKRQVMEAEGERRKEATVTERDELIRLFNQLSPQLSLLDSKPKPIPLTTLKKGWTGHPNRLELVLDDLLADGRLIVKGSGARRKYLLD